MNRPRRHHTPGAVLAAAVAAFSLTLAGCSDAQGVASPLDANLIASAQEGLSGTWMLNEGLSERPDHRPLGGRPDLNGDRPGRPGIGANRPPDGPLGRDGRGRPSPPSTLQIAQTEESVSLAGPDGRSHTLYTDGRTETHELPNGDIVQVQARWTDAGLTIVRTGSRGTHTEAFALSHDEQQLTVTVHMAPADRSDTKTFRLVYDRQ